MTNAKLSSELGNLIKVSDILGSDASISDDNAVDFAQAICESADEELIGEEKLYLYVPQAFINLYNRNYLKKFGNVPYNTGYNHNTIEGFDNVEMVPLVNKKNAPFFQLTTRNNMLVGVNEANNSDEEKISVEKYHPWKLDFIATKFFGCQYESINKERLLVITNDGTTPLINKKTSLAEAASNTASGDPKDTSSSDTTDDEGKE